MSVCTNGAACMTGRVRGFIAKIKTKNIKIVTNHCILYWEVLAAKTFLELAEVLDEAVWMVNGQISELCLDQFWLAAASEYPNISTRW